MVSVQKNHGRERSFMGVGGAIENQESIGGNWKFQAMQWLFIGWATGSLPLAGLLLGKEESFLPPCKVGVLWECKVPFFLLGSVMCVECPVWELSSSLLSPLWMSSPFWFSQDIHPSYQPPDAPDTPSWQPASPTRWVKEPADNSFLPPSPQQLRPRALEAETRYPKMLTHRIWEW